LPRKKYKQTTKKIDRITIQGRGTPNISETYIKTGSHTTKKSTIGYATHVQNNMARKARKTPYNMHVDTSNKQNKRMRNKMDTNRKEEIYEIGKNTLLDTKKKRKQKATHQQKEREGEKATTQTGTRNILDQNKPHSKKKIAGNAPNQHAKQQTKMPDQ